MRPGPALLGPSRSLLSSEQRTLPVTVTGPAGLHHGSQPQFLLRRVDATQPEGQGMQHRVGGSPLSQAAHGAAPGGKVTGADGWPRPPLGVGISPDVDPTPWAPRWGDTLITWITLLQVAPACRRVWAVWADWRSRWNPEDGGG